MSEGGGGECRIPTEKKHKQVNGGHLNIDPKLYAKYQSPSSCS